MKFNLNIDLNNIPDDNLDYDDYDYSTDLNSDSDMNVGPIEYFMTPISSM